MATRPTRAAGCLPPTRTTFYSSLSSQQKSPVTAATGGANLDGEQLASGQALRRADLEWLSPPTGYNREWDQRRYTLMTLSGDRDQNSIRSCLSNEAVRYSRCLRLEICLTTRRVQVSKVGKSYFTFAIILLILLHT
jgi:hypothetical protein